MHLNKSIIYVNFSPYENTGKILDYLLKNFKFVYTFTFDFHKVKQQSRLEIYINGEFIFRKQLYSIPTTEGLIFVLLPIRSFLIFIQLFWYIWLLRNTIQKPCLYFTVNAFTIWVGNLLKKVKLIDKTIFWVWDYYPPNHPNPIIKLMRRIYWYFDTEGSRSDKVVYLNTRLKLLHQKINTPSKIESHQIVPIGTNPVGKASKPAKTPLKLGFIGVLKKSQGLELIFNQWQEITHNFPNAKIEIIGTGPDHHYFEQLAIKNGVNARFYGLLREQNKNENIKINRILANCHIGIATYIPEKSNVSYYGDPSKIKRYLSSGLPIITTNVFEFSPIIAEQKAGLIISYHNPKDLIEAITKIYFNNMYSKNAYKLALRYNYQTLYKSMFTFSEK